MLKVIDKVGKQKPLEIQLKLKNFWNFNNGNR